MMTDTSTEMVREFDNIERFGIYENCGCCPHGMMSQSEGVPEDEADWVEYRNFYNLWALTTALAAERDTLQKRVEELEVGWLPPSSLRQMLEDDRDSWAKALAISLVPLPDIVKGGSIKDMADYFKAATASILAEHDEQKTLVQHELEAVK